MIDWHATTTPADGIVLSTLGTVLVCMVLAWIAIGQPLLGRALHRRFLAALDAGRLDARVRFYRLGSAKLWLLAAIVLLLGIGSPGVGLARLGLRWPATPLDAGVTTVLWTCLLLGVLGVLVAGSVFSIRRTQAKAAAQSATPSSSKLTPMLPRNRRERWYWACLALSAGICEEIVWRGFLLAALVALFPGLGAWLYVLVIALVFGIGHLYQGIGGMFVSGFIGAIFAALYLMTGSLWLVMLLHTLIDLHPLLLSRGNPRWVDRPDLDDAGELR